MIREEENKRPQEFLYIKNKIVESFPREMKSIIQRPGKNWDGRISRTRFNNYQVRISIKDT